MERRFLSRPEYRVHLQERADGQQPLIAGYAAVFYRAGVAGTEYELWHGLLERIAPGAFDRALREKDDARGLFNHDPNLVLGRVSAETLRLSVDEIGLRYEIDPPATQAARDVIESIRRGDVSGSSFKFCALRESWAYGKDGQPDVRTLEEVRLWDVSPVTYPAYEATSTGLRADGDLAALRAQWLEAKIARARGRARLRTLELD